MRRADVKHDARPQAGRQGRDNSFKGLNASSRSSNDHNVSGFCQIYRRAFSIARPDADHLVPALSKPTFGCKPTFALLELLSPTGPTHEPSLMRPIKGFARFQAISIISRNSSGS